MSLPALSSVMDFYPRPPRGGRPLLQLQQCPVELISIHALREEGDPKRVTQKGGDRRFLSTPSARRATELRDAPAANAGISIHALREEGDAIEGDKTYESVKFLSTPSARRATLCKRILSPSWGEFLSTPSARRATAYTDAGFSVSYISIHALREEGDRCPPSGCRS